MSKKPIFQPIFGSQWESLPQVLKHRYANRAECDDAVVVEGVLDVKVSRWMKFLAPLLRMCGALVPYAGKDIPVTVRFNSCEDSNAVGFNRHFRFTTRAPYYFRSILQPTGGDGVIEFMKFGLGWRMRYEFSEGKAKLLHDGYLWRIFGVDIPMPFTWILGRGYAFEQAVSDTEFDMYFEIIHPWFGKVFGYEGHFQLEQFPR